MSGFVGIWNLDRRPVDVRLLKRMTETIAHRGPDGSGHWVDRSVALAHRMLITTPEAVHERQPVTDETNSLCLAFDGRVDNRDELKARLRSKGIELRTDTDAELVLKAYDCWGPECPIYILGDFAFVIWDGRNQQIFCARDPIGTKPLYYYHDRRIFLCASELQPFFVHPEVTRELNEGMLGEFLAADITSQEETLYGGLLHLPPAHSLVVTPDRLQKVRYWTIDPEKIISYKSDQEYADHFLDLFRESVRCRLRSHAPVGSYLSGGLDSSSVVGMAQSLYRQGLAVDRGFETFSLVFPGLHCDEQPFIDQVVRQWDLVSNRVRPQAHGRAVWAGWARQDQDFPGYPNGTMGNPLRAVARQKGFRVLLTGGGGDEWLTGSTFHAADLLRRGLLLSLVRRIGRDSGYTTVGDMVRAFLQYGVAPLFPSGLYRRIKGFVKGDGIPPWINRDFARRIHLADRLVDPSGTLRFATFAQKNLYGALVCGWWTHTFEIEERAAGRFGLEERHPLTDRRLVEFALALPEGQRWRRAVPKFILRQAMRGLLPEMIRQRLTKVQFSPVFSEAFEAVGARKLLDSPVAVSQGWVDGPSLRRMCEHLERLSDGGTGESFPYLWPLWMIVALEIWHDAVWLNPSIPSKETVHKSELAALLV